MIVDEEKKKRKSIILLVIVVIIVIGGVSALLYFNMNRPEKIFNKVIRYGNEKLASFYQYNDSLREIIESFKSSSQISIERNGKTYDDVKFNYDQTLNYKKKQLKILAELFNNDDSVLSVYGLLDKNSFTIKSDQLYDKAIVFSYNDISKFWDMINSSDSSNIQIILNGIANSLTKHYNDDTSIISGNDTIKITNSYKVKSFTLSYADKDTKNLVINIFNDLVNDKDVYNAMSALTGEMIDIKDFVDVIKDYKFSNMSFTVYTNGYANNVVGFGFSYDNYSFSSYDISGERYLKYKNNDDELIFIGTNSNGIIKGKLLDEENTNLANISIEKKDNQTDLSYKNDVMEISLSLKNDTDQINFGVKYDTSINKIKINTVIDTKSKSKFPGITDKIDSKDIKNINKITDKASDIFSKTAISKWLDDVNDDAEYEHELKYFNLRIQPQIFTLSNDIYLNYKNKTGCFNISEFIDDDNYFGYVKIIKVNDKYQSYVTIGYGNVVIVNHNLDNLKDNKYTVSKKDPNTKYTC